MSRNMLILIVAAMLIVFGIYVMKDTPENNGEKLFPGILGDTILKSNETGIYFIKDITNYDNFTGNIIQGYKATYSGSNGTIMIFAANMQDNNSANTSFNDMAIRLGYNQSLDFNQSIKNNESVMKLPVKNPIVFMIHKDKDLIWHYSYTKSDKVYWIGFNNTDMEYQISMLIEAYRNIDKDNNSNDII